MAVSNLFAPFRVASIATLFLFLGLSAHAQRDDWHMFSQDLFVKSCFAHGYMHGYEEGFHSGDLDMQMGRAYRPVKNQEHYKKTVGYKPQFGTKALFDDGYRNGFLVGYTDSYAGRNFRAVQLVRANQKKSSSPDAQSDHEFDSAFREGYISGQREGLKDGRSSAAENKAPFQCDEMAAQRKGSEGEGKANYCEAFRSGYQLGYSDGYANQHEDRGFFAKK